MNNHQIEQVKTKILLGITLDAPKLNFKAHIADLKANCVRRLSIMKCISSIKWGASSVILKRFYQAYIRAKIVYGSAVFAGVDEKVFQKLNVLQNSCLRLILGARRTTPILSLEAESGIMPLNLYLSFACI